VNSLWSNLFSESMTTTVIVPDATSAMLQEATRQPVDLATYLRRSPNPESERLQAIEKTLRGFSIRRYTTFDGVSTAVKIVQLAEQFRSRTIVRYALSCPQPAARDFIDRLNRVDAELIRELREGLELEKTP